MKWKWRISNEMTKLLRYKKVDLFMKTRDSWSCEAQSGTQFVVAQKLQKIACPVVEA